MKGDIGHIAPGHTSSVIRLDCSWPPPLQRGHRRRLHFITTKFGLPKGPEGHGVYIKGRTSDREDFLHKQTSAEPQAGIDGAICIGNLLLWAGAVTPSVLLRPDFWPLVADSHMTDQLHYTSCLNAKDKERPDVTYRPLHGESALISSRDSPTDIIRSRCLV